MKALGSLAQQESRERRIASPRYGRVFFDLRRRFSLSVEECLLVDVIETLSRRTGWCYASRGYLAEILGISRRSLQRMLRRLLDVDLVESKVHRSRQLRPGVRWRRAKLDTRG